MQIIQITITLQPGQNLQVEDEDENLISLKEHLHRLVSRELFARGFLYESVKSLETA